MVGQIYPTELQLNKANSSDTETRDAFFFINFEKVNSPFIDGDVPCSPSYDVYTSWLIRFARVCSNVDDFNNRNLFLTAKLLKRD